MLDINLQAKPSLRNCPVARIPYRRTAHKKFNKQLYRLRKLNESIFVILAKRGILVPRRTTIALSAKAALWACVGHNLDSLIGVELNRKIFKWVCLPVQEEMPVPLLVATNQELSALQENSSTLKESPENIPTATIMKSNIEHIMATEDQFNVTMADNKALPSLSKSLAATKTESNPISSPSTQL